MSKPAILPADDAAPVARAHYVEALGIDLIVPSPANPRTHREDDPALASLTDSIRAKGVLEPILVRPTGDRAYEIIAGERRWRASKRAGRETIPAIVRNGLSDQEALELTVTENLQREDLHPLEEAKGYQQFLQLPGYDVVTVADRICRSVKYVYDRLKLLSLTKPAQELFWGGKVTAGHAILLARLRPEEQARAIEKGLFEREEQLWNPLEGDGQEFAKKPVSVRELQGWIDEHVKFDVDWADPMLFPEARASVTKAREAAEKIVPITFDHHIQEDARDSSRVFGPRSWKEASGRGEHPTCEHSVLGVIVVGPGRGETLRVCTAKKTCKVHWAKEQRDAAANAKAKATSGATGQDRWREQEAKRKAEHERREAERARFKKARVAILEALAEKVKKAPVRPAGLLAEILIQAVKPRVAWNDKAVDLGAYLSAGKDAADVVRFAAFSCLVDELVNFDAADKFPKRAKALGIDVKKLVDQVAPAPEVQTSAVQPRKKAASAPAKKSAKAKRPKKAKS